MKFSIKKGLKLPISGEPQESLDLSKESKKIAVIGADFIGMKPTMQVKVGDDVKIGQPLFSCKKNIGLIFTSPGAGKVVAVNRGARRLFQSVEIELSKEEESVTFATHVAKPAKDYTADEVTKLLIESGEWKGLIQRPFAKVADVTLKPEALFITASDTNPLAPNPDFVIGQFKDEFKAGVEALSKLSKGKTYVCKMKGSSVEAHGAELAEFSGPHPAGNAGTHIHFIDPVNPNKIVWHIDYQDVIAVGRLVLTGTLLTDRMITIGGPLASSPRYLKVRKGAQVSELISGEAKEGKPLRVVAGSVFNGHKAEGSFDFLGAYTNQITLIEEDDKRELLGWHSPGFDKFSIRNTFLSKLIPGKTFDLGSSTHGSLRAMVPTGAFEKVMPMDILPTQLLRALASNDTDQAQDLGCLELAEEDIALLTFASPGKVDFGPLLRQNLDTIEREG